MKDATLIRAAFAAALAGGVLVLWMWRRRSSASGRSEAERLRQQLRDSQDRLVAEIDTIGKSRGQLAGQVENVRRNAEHIGDRLKTLDDYLKQSKGQMQAFDKLQSSMTDVAGQVQASQRRAQSVIDGLDSEYHGVRSLVMSLTSIVDKLKNVAEQYQGHQDRLTRRDDSLESATSALVASNDRISSQSESLARAVEDFQTQVTPLLDELNSQVKKLGEVNDLLTTYALSIPDQMNQLKSDHDEMVDAIRRLANTALIYETSKQELADTIDDRQATVERLEDQLSSLEQQRSDEQRRHRKTVDGLRQQEATLQHNNQVLQDTLEKASTENAYLNQRVAGLEAAEHEEHRVRKSDWHLRQAPNSFDELIQAVREMFPETVALPDSAPVKIDELQSALGAQQLVAAIWQAIGAMHEFAALNPPYSGNFFTWCRDSGHPRAYSASDVAMTESESTKNAKGKDRHSREFYVDSRVSSTGKIDMHAHIKFGGGGQNVPRLFFHDDTRGETRKFHIGFLGPHNEVKNAGSN